MIVVISNVVTLIVVIYVFVSVGTCCGFVSQWKVDFRNWIRKLIYYTSILNIHKRDLVLVLLYILVNFDLLYLNF